MINLILILTFEFHPFLYILDIKERFILFNVPKYITIAVKSS